MDKRAIARFAKKGLLVGLRVERKDDGHRRVSRGKDFVAIGGTREGHEHLRETCAGISDEVRSRGRSLAEVGREEIGEILEKVADRVGPAPG